MVKKILIKLLNNHVHQIRFFVFENNLFEAFIKISDKSP